MFDIFSQVEEPLNLATTITQQSLYQNNSTKQMQMHLCHIQCVHEKTAPLSIMV